MKVTATEVVPGVHQITVGEPAFEGVFPPNVYLVVGREKSAIIDSAYGKDDEIEAQLDLWRANGSLPVEAIVMTHRHSDHIGGAAKLALETGGVTVCSIVEKNPIEEAIKDFTVERPVEDGETADLGGVTLEFIHTPGHTMGSLCVLHREEAILFTGDTILGAGTVAVSPEQGDMALYLDSLRKLLGYEAKLICPGHGPVIADPSAKIHQLISHRGEREQQILRLIGEGNSTIEDVFKAIYPAINPGLHNMARGQVRAHLIKLTREGKVREHSDGHYSIV